MGTSWGQVVKEQKDTYKGIEEYTKCQSKTFTQASISTIGIAAIIFIVTSTKPLERLVQVHYRILFGTVAGCAYGWYFATTRTKFCQEMWLALEDKQTYLKKLDEERTTMVTKNE